MGIIKQLGIEPDNRTGRHHYYKTLFAGVCMWYSSGDPCGRHVFITTHRKR